MRLPTQILFAMALLGASAARAQFCPQDIIPRCDGSQGNPGGGGGGGGGPPPPNSSGSPGNPGGSGPPPPSASSGPSHFGDPVDVDEGQAYMRETDFELPLSQGSLPFIRMYVSQARSYSYSKFPEGFLHTTSTDYVPRPFGEHRYGNSLNWWHNFYSSVLKGSATGADAEVRDVDGFRNYLQWSSQAATSGRWFVNLNNEGSPDRLWQDTSDGSWPSKFVYYRQGSGRYVYDAVYVHPGSTARHYFLGRILDTEYGASGQPEVPRATVEYAPPSTDGGTEPDPACHSGAAGSTPGVPFIRTVTSRDGNKLHFYYRRLTNTRGRVECVLDHVNVEDVSDGGTTERTLVQYQYGQGGNELVQVDHPQTGRSRQYTYPTGQETSLLEIRESGALVSRHSYSYSSATPMRDEAQGHDYAITDVSSSRPGVRDSCTQQYNGEMPTREFADSKAGLGTGETGQTTLTTRFTSAPAYSAHQSYRLNSIEKRCDGTSCPGLVPGIESWEYECPGFDSSVVPAMTKAHKDMRSSWELYTHQAPDAGTAMAEGVPLSHMKTLTRVVAGAQDSSGTGSLAEVRFGYTSGSTSQPLRAYEQLLERQEVASVLAPSGEADPTARSQYVYDPLTNRVKAEFRTGWTQVRDSNGVWKVEKRRIGVFLHRAPQCGGVGAEDAQGRVLETHGPCFVDAATADVASITGCPAGTPFPVTKYEYWSQAEAGHRRNRLKKWSVLPGGCAGTTSLDVQYLEYDAFGNATRIQDANGGITEREFNQELIARSTVVAGATSTTTHFTYEQGRLKAIQYPEGNYDVFCYRAGTPAGQGCTGGTQTYLLQWTAKAADANGTSWSERIDYAYWPDETLKSATFLRWNGSAAETRRVMSFSADARRRPTFQGLGSAPSAVKSTRLFDANGNLTGLGAPYNNPPAVCGGPDSAGQPASPLCTVLGYDRLDRLSRLDEFPDATTQQRTCFTYDAQSHVTSVRQGCAVGSGTGDCSSCAASVPAAEYRYDDFDNLVEVKLPYTGTGTAEATRYVHDALGRAVLKETPQMRLSGERVSYEYDTLGRLLRAKRHYTSPQAGQENLFVLSHDMNDAADATSTPPADCPQPTHTTGRLRYRHDSFGRTWYQYDAHGRVVGEIRLREGQTSCGAASLADRPHTFYTYTANGNLASVIHPHGRVVTYVYGSGARVDRPEAIDVRLWSASGFTDTRLLSGIVWEPYGDVRGYQLNHPASGNSSALEYMLGDDAGQAPVACPSTPPSTASSDQTGRLRALRVSSGSFTPGTSSGDIYKRTYTWAGDQVAQSDTCLLGAATPRIETFQYDRTLRLKAAGRPAGNFAATGGAFDSRSYGHDGRGNRTALSEDGAVFEVGLEAAPAVDWLEKWGVATGSSLLRYALSHDADGRVTQKRWAAKLSGTPVYALGFEHGQSTGVATDTVFRSVNVNGAFYNYFYDALGRRRLKSHPGGTTDEYFHGTGSQLLTDRGSNGFSVPVGHFTTDDYVWLGGRPVALVRAKFSNAWVRQPDGTGDCARDGEPVACGVYFPVTDHIGKPVLLLDGARHVAGAADHDPFGHVNRVSRVAETAHPHLHNMTATLATFSQPKENSSVAIRMRARYHLVDTASAAYTWWAEAGTSQELGRVSGTRRGRVVTPWAAPSNGSLEVRFTAGPREGVQCPESDAGTGNESFAAPRAESLQVNDAGVSCECLSYPCNCCALAGPETLGVVLEGYEYQRYQVGAQPFWIPLRFPSQYHDAETDLFENWNRYYDPSTGRYLQPEPLLQSPRYVGAMAKTGPSVPVYSYALNNPLYFIDPDGLHIRTVTNVRYDYVTPKDRPFTRFSDFSGTFKGCTKKNGRWKFDVDLTANLDVVFGGHEDTPSLNDGNACSIRDHEEKHVQDFVEGLSEEVINAAIRTEGFRTPGECDNAMKSFQANFRAYADYLSWQTQSLRDPFDLAR